MMDEKKQKVILIICNNDAGLYNFRLELIEKLIKDKNRVVISLPNGNRVADLVNLGCEFIETDISRRGTNPIRDFGLFIKYIGILKAVKPDMVLSYTIKPNAYGGMACQLLKIPYMANITGLGTAFENGGLMQKFAINLYKIALRKAKKVFVQNSRIMDFLEDKKIALGRHELLPGSGVNLDRFTSLEYPNDDVIKFVFIARIMEEKGIDEYLEAADYIKQKYKNTEFHICGFCEDEYKDKLNELTQNNNVVYHGSVKDIREILKCMHCTVVPSYHEGMSNVLLESAASARVCICSDIPGCKEAVEHGITGYTFEVKNSDALICSIEKFMNLSYEDKKQMGLNGRKKMENEFDRNIVINKYIKEIGENQDELI